MKAKALQTERPGKTNNISSNQLETSEQLKTVRGVWKRLLLDQI